MSYLSTIQADNPTHYWRLSDFGQIVHDIGSNPAQLGAPIVGGAYTGITLDGGSYLVQSNGGPHIDVQLQSLAAPMSLECWFWPLWNTGANQFLFAWDGLGATPSPQIALNSSFIPEAFFTNAVFADVNPITSQAWHYFVSTWAGAAEHLYVDGSLVASNAGSGTAVVQHPLGIGSLHTAGGNVLGFVCEAAIYSQALSSAQVLSHFLAQEINTIPSYLGPGATSPSTGGVTSTIADLGPILAAVRKTFPTT